MSHQIVSESSFSLTSSRFTCWRWTLETLWHRVTHGWINLTSSQTLMAWSSYRTAVAVKEFASSTVVEVSYTITHWITHTHLLRTFAFAAKCYYRCSRTCRDINGTAYHETVKFSLPGNRWRSLVTQHTSTDEWSECVVDSADNKSFSLNHSLSKWNMRFLLKTKKQVSWIVLLSIVGKWNTN